MSPVGGEFRAPLSSDCVGPSSEVWPRVKAEAIRPISPLNPHTLRAPQELEASWDNAQGLVAGVPG